MVIELQAEFRSLFLAEGPDREEVAVLVVKLGLFRTECCQCFIPRQERQRRSITLTFYRSDLDARNSAWSSHVEFVQSVGWFSIFLITRLRTSQLRSA